MVHFNFLYLIYQKQWVFMILLFCGFFNAQAQIAKYAFDENLTESINNFNGQRLLDGAESNDAPTYIDGVNGKAVQLGIHDGIVLPTGINDLIDFNKSFEISIDFKMIEAGDGEAIKYIVDIKSSQGNLSAGLAIYTYRHLDDKGKPEYELKFNYADDTFDGEPSHPGSIVETIGRFKVDEWVNLRVIIDFEAMTWATIANGRYTKADFDDFFDYDIIKGTLKNTPFRVGWASGVDSEIQCCPHVYTSTVAYDNLEINYPKKDGDVNVLTTALNGMRDHVDGTNILDLDVTQNYLTDILINFEGKYDEVKDIVKAFMSNYETFNAPLFDNRQHMSISKLWHETQALFFIQQWIHDNLFVPDRIDDAIGIKFEAADAFPGRVEPDAPRLDNQQIEIKATYNVDPGGRIGEQDKGVIRPTGYYAAPGELITVKIDPEYADDGLLLMVGAHQFDMSNHQESLNRFVRISKEFEIKGAETKIANPFGGGIYIKIPNGTSLGWIDLTISGAVRAPFFSFREGRKTDPADWKALLDQKHVPWVDLESDKYMLTVPLAMMQDVSDPTHLMTLWDKITDTYRSFGGRPEEPVRAEYWLMDARLPYGGYSAGYPQIDGSDQAPYGNLESHFLSPMRVLDPEFWTGDIHITFHEMGHTALHPTLPDEFETVVNVNAANIYNNVFGLELEEAFKYSEHQKFTLDQSAMDWMMTANFKNNNLISCSPLLDNHVCDELRYQHRGHAKYIEIAKVFGWEAMGKINKIFYDKWKSEDVEYDFGVSRDEYIRAASTAMEINMAPFFHFWGVHPSDELRLELAALPKSDKILERLNYYKSIVPANKEAFQVWYDLNYPTVGDVHYPRYNTTLANFDTENSGQKMVDQIDFIIDRYFTDIDEDGDGSPLGQDCDDSNADVHPGATEIPYNGIDDDCNPQTLDDDLDQDGFKNADDCDDTNAEVNPDATEIPYNGLDDDCDPQTLDDDLDQDGFKKADDCDDENANINPDQSEIPYNGIDDDCDPQTPDDDVDQDGFKNADDCDDTKAEVNPDATEVPYNGLDDDCDPQTRDDDLDQDGFNQDVDCDDNDPEINPDTGYKKENDCELVVSIEDQYQPRHFSVYPSPYSGKVTVRFESNYFGPVEIQVSDLNGRNIVKNVAQKSTPEFNHTLNIEGSSQGIQVLTILIEGQIYLVKKLLKQQPLK